VEHLGALLRCSLGLQDFVQVMSLCCKVLHSLIKSWSIAWLMGVKAFFVLYTAAVAAKIT
jgi:hypothetical protein